ncbi:MAG: acyl carrier protein [Lachnospiraceae bacterium]|nr:acyl carrier protein [Lachnospiraceae bacterium]
MNDYLKEVIQKVKEMLSEDVAVEGDAPLCAEIGLTSMQLAQLAYELEEAFDVEIPDAAFKSDMTAEDFAEIIRSELEGERGG